MGVDPLLINKSPDLPELLLRLRHVEKLNLMVQKLSSSHTHFLLVSLSSPSRFKTQATLYPLFSPLQPAFSSIILIPPSFHINVNQFFNFSEFGYVFQLIPLIWGWVPFKGFLFYKISLIDLFSNNRTTTKFPDHTQLANFGFKDIHSHNLHLGHGTII